MTTETTGGDFIDRLLALDEDSLAHRLRHRRHKVVQATQAFHDEAFHATGATPAQRRDRLFVAALTAQASGPTILADAYRQQLAAQEGAQSHLAALAGHDAATSPTLQILGRYADQLARKPAAADRAALSTLTQAGWTVPEVVELAQIMGYVSYQARMLIGLQALAALAPSDTDAAAASPVQDAPFIHPAHLPAPGQRLDINGYTNATLGWKAWLPVQESQDLTEQQAAILDASHPAARDSDYYMLLVRAPALLAQRSEVYNAIMYASGGAPRHERELASAAVSRINGCIYCASVHAQRYEQLSKRNDVIAQLFENPHTAGTTARERAIIRGAIALTENPAAFDSQSLQPLLAAGVSEDHIMDLLSATAIFAWANRLMLNLGEHVMPDDGPATVQAPPSWSDAPAGWDWLAQDADGRWFWYAVEPQLGVPGGIWRAPRRAQQFAAQGDPNPQWHESCRQRPA